MKQISLTNIASLNSREWLKKNLSFIILAWFINLFFSIIPVMIFFPVLYNSTYNFGNIQELTSYKLWPTRFWMDFQWSAGSTIDSFSYVLFFVIIINLFVSLFLSMIFVGSLNEKQDFKISSSFVYVSRYFGKYFQLFILTLLFLILTISCFSWLYSCFIELLNVSNEFITLMLDWLRELIILFIWIIVILIGDYTKPVIVIKENKNVLFDIDDAIRFIFNQVKNVIKISLKYVVVFLLIMLFLFLVTVIVSNISNSNVFIIKLIFFQIGIISRLILKYWFNGTQFFHVYFRVKESIK